MSDYVVAPLWCKECFDPSMNVEFLHTIAATSHGNRIQIALCTQNNDYCLVNHEYSVNVKVCWEVGSHYRHVIADINEWEQWLLTHISGWLLWMRFRCTDAGVPMMKCNWHTSWAQISICDSVERVSARVRNLIHFSHRKCVSASSTAFKYKSQNNC